MIILGIETSCDETSAAIIEGDETKEVILKSNVTSTSLDLHKKTGGIIPENAAREQIKYIIPVIQKALIDAEIEFKQIDTIGITYGPGLIGSLLVGVETAKTLSFVLDKPIVPVNHMLGHIYANFISDDSKLNPKPYTLIPEIEFPAIALVVSGGHTDLLLLRNHGDLELLGGTRDDAAGECFDKCARLLGYNYPGGPKIAELGKKGDPLAFPFPKPMLDQINYDFSFSGLKTAFLNETHKHFAITRHNTSDSKIGWQQVAEKNFSSPLEKKTLYDLCASLEKAIVDVLVIKTMRAAKKHAAKSILISGGVASNQLLRDRFRAVSDKSSINFFVPSKNLCTDNAAMIASAAFYNYNPIPWDKITADPELYF